MRHLLMLLLVGAAGAATAQQAASTPIIVSIDADAGVSSPPGADQPKIYRLRSAQPEVAPPQTPPVQYILVSPAPSAPPPAMPAPPVPDAPAPEAVALPAAPSLPPEAMPVASPPEVKTSAAILDGHLRQGPFLAGPGSFMFVLHHTLLGAAGGFATQALAYNFDLTRVDARTATLTGTLIGAGLGFAIGAWWQFTHWLDKPVAEFSLVSSVLGGMLVASTVGLVTLDPAALAWSAFVGAELGAWMTTGLGGGQMSLASGLAITSGAGWAAAYAALLLATIATSRGNLTPEGVVQTLLIAPGIGALILAAAQLQFHPTVRQTLRADLFGGGIGAAVLLVAALATGGFVTPLPYILAMVASAGTIAAVSIFWVEEAERPPVMVPAPGASSRNVWW